MRKAFTVLFSFIIALSLIILIRFSGGLRDGKPLFGAYEPTEVLSIASPDGEWEIRGNDGSWIWVSDGIEFPARQSSVQGLLELPGKLKGHLAGKFKGSGGWLPDSELTLNYERKNKAPLRMTVYYDPSVSGEDERGFYIKKEGDDRGLYYHRLAFGTVFPWENLLETRIFPEELRPESIVYYRLYTPREGPEALQYRYELIRESEEWTYRGELGEGRLKEDEINLLMIRLAGLEGEFMDWEDPSVPESDVRFRVEIHDNRGSRYVLTVGGNLKLNGTDYYRVVLEKGNIASYMTREVLGEIARPLSSLLEL